MRIVKRYTFLVLLLLAGCVSEGEQFSAENFTPPPFNLNAPDNLYLAKLQSPLVDIIAIGMADNRIVELDGCVAVQGYDGTLRHMIAQPNLFIIGSTEMLCEDERMAGDLLWNERAQQLHRYEIEGDRLSLFTPAGDAFEFVREGAISAESRIYAAVINDWSDGGYLFVREPAFNQAGVSAAETRQQLEALFSQRGEREAISAELLDAFFAAQTDTLSLTLPNGDPTFISQAELDNIFADGEEQGWQTIAERFPDVQLIFTLSNVGFSDNEALVYSAIRMPQQETGYYSIRTAGNGNYLGNSTSLLWSANE